MNTLTYHTEDRTIDGQRYRVEFIYDDMSEPPWVANDGHGPIRNVHSRYGKRELGKKPGEVILHYDRGDYWLYDFAAAMKQARTEGWGGAGGNTPGERAAAAVRADMDYLRGYMQQDWYYIGVRVAAVDEHDDEIADASLWGIESSSDDYREEVIRDLVRECAIEIESKTYPVSAVGV